MVMTKGGTSDYGDAVPSAGGPDYGFPTPHAAAVAQEPFTAPSSGNASPGGGVAHGAFDAMENGLGAPTPTAGEAAEKPQRYDV